MVCSLVSAGVLLYYATRHPHPKFRPKLGEIVLVGMIFFGISVVITAMTAGLFDQENLDDSAKKTQKRSSPARSSGGGGGIDLDDKGGDRKDDAKEMFKEELPPFVPEDD